MRKFPAASVWLAAAVAQLLLALFFFFVGGMKTAAPMAVLEQHHAWVASLPVLVARTVGVSEVLCAAALLAGMVVRRMAWWAGIAAWLLIANQAVAVGFHLIRGELAGSGRQNLVLVLALAAIGVLRCFPGSNLTNPRRQQT